MFRDRIDAAIQLIPHLEKFSGQNGIVLAIPRGGVPVGAVIARAIHFPLDVVLTKKIGHPQNPEYAIGAVSLDGYLIHEKHEDVSDDYLQSEIARIRNLLKIRQRKIRGARLAPDLRDKTILLVDDGIATGLTVTATIQLLRKSNPAKIILAVPVAPREVAERMRTIADEFICLETPSDFYGVGQYYEDFQQVDDEEVSKLMEENSGNKTNLK